MARVIAKATRVSEDLGWACRRVEGLRPRSAATLWKAIVRPVLEYAAEIWAGDISASSAAKAEAVMAKCRLVENASLQAKSLPGQLF